MKKKTPPVVFLNASVVLAGLKNPAGGSGKILSWVKRKKILGIISEVVLDEVLRNAAKIGQREERVLRQLGNFSLRIIPPPSLINVKHFEPVVVDYGDSHILASAKEIKADFLVSLDKKHLLILKEKIRDFKIVAPADLIEELWKLGGNGKIGL